MPDAARRRRAWSPRRWVLVMGAALLVVAAVAVFAIFLPMSSANEADTQVVRAIRSTQTTTVTLSGTLAPQQQANASFAVSGTVTAVDVRVGDQVTQGQALASVDDRDLRNAVTLASANVSAARAQLQTVGDADEATSAAVAAAEAQVASAQASLEDARKRLGDAVLVAPLGGVVAAVNVSVGDQVSGTAGASLGSAASGLSGSNPLSGGVDLSSLSGGSSSASGSTGGQVQIVVPDAWKLEAEVGTADLPALSAGQEAVVTPTGTTTAVPAVVDTVGIVATSASGSVATFPVTLRVTQSGVRLFAGANADAVVTTGVFDDVLTVPAEAVTTADGASNVQAPANGVSRSVTVTTGRRFGDRIEILSGLAEGDEILAPAGIVVTPPARPQFGPNGTLASPDASASATP